jgi:catechol 2,3-dioxygenase-like lactoylglutathione lyase family enzyme
VAFWVPAAELAEWERRMEHMGIAIESTVDWRPGVRSIYFRDPDQHLVELATPGVWSADC